MNREISIAHEIHDRDACLLEAGPEEVGGYDAVPHGGLPGFVKQFVPWRSCSGKLIR
jgi:hypothetical protein